MSFRDFWDIYDSLHTTDDRIEFILTTEVDLSRESQPECLASRFPYSIVWEDALRAARAMVRRIGYIMVAGETASCSGEMTTIVDTAHIWEEDRLNCNPVIIAALRTLGVRKASEYAPRDLFMAYNHMYPDIPVNDYYDELAELLTAHKQNMEAIYPEIVAAVFHPDRIARWICAGNNAEDYMM